MSSAGPGEPRACVVWTDDGDLSEPILACVRVRVVGGRGEWGGSVVKTHKIKTIILHTTVPCVTMPIIRRHTY